MKRFALAIRLAASVERLGLNGPGVVAVSGGPDSVALLHALLQDVSGVSGTALIVAHLNHQLRGDASEADEDFVRGLHARLAANTERPVGLLCQRIDVRGLAEASAENLEATARRVRYEWLTGVARVKGATWVATGHTADDQAETVLHRLLRGTGLQGLRGIAERRPLGEGIDLVRPLLHVTRAEVMDYLAAIDQPFCHDASNADLGLTRNRIRHDLLPHLAKHYNPGVVEVLTRLAEQATEVFAEEEAAAKELLGEAELPRAGAWIVLDRRRLTTVNPRSLRELFRLLWRREEWPAGRMDFQHWDRLAAFVTSQAPELELPGGLVCRRYERTLLLGRGNPV